MVLLSVVLSTLALRLALTDAMAAWRRTETGVPSFGSEGAARLGGGAFFPRRFFKCFDGLAGTLPPCSAAADPDREPRPRF